MSRNLGNLILLLGCLIGHLEVTRAKVFTCDSRVGCGCSRNSADINARIVGGEVAATNSWGWAVSLRDAGGSNFCGGVILSPWYILTAAHCLEDLYLPASRYSVEVGTNVIQERLGQIIPFASVTNHPGYNSITKENDIGIVRLSRAISFTDPNVARLCLPEVNVPEQARYPVVGKPLVAIGWGTLSSGGFSTFSLRQVTVSTVDSDERKCSRSINNNRLQFCAAVNGGGKDTCQGDSGGPIMYYSEEDRVWVLAGLTSYGRGCGLSDYAGVYTRVSPYNNWIRSVVGSGNFMTIQQTTTSTSTTSSSGISGSSVVKQSFSTTFIMTVLLPMFIKVFRFL